MSKAFVSIELVILVVYATLLIETSGVFVPALWSAIYLGIAAFGNIRASSLRSINREHARGYRKKLSTSLQYERLCDFYWYEYQIQIMKLKVLVHAAEEGGFWAEIPALPGCVSEGDTFEKTIANIHEAAEGWLAVSAEQAAEQASAQDEEVQIAEIEL